MTLSGSVSTSLSRTGRYLKKRLWIFPIAGVFALLTIGAVVRHAIETTMRESLSSELRTLLNVEVEMLKTWFRTQELNAETAAKSTDVRQAVYELVDKDGVLAAGGEGDTPSDPAESARRDDAARVDLKRALAPVLAAQKHVGYFVTDCHGTVVAASDTQLIGKSGVPEYERTLHRVLDGHATVSPPFHSVATLQDAAGRRTGNVPVMLAAAPVRDMNFSVVGAIFFQLRPDDGFTRILQLGRIGDSGETYAINGDARMLSDSRFTPDLIKHRLLPDVTETSSLLRLLVVDPGGNLLEGHVSEDRPTKLEPTRMALSAIAGETAFDVDGYRDYRGVPVIGAWTWLEDYGIGVATEVDVEEAYRPLFILRWTFIALMTLLTLAAVALFVSTLVVARLQREARHATVAAKQLGQYKLERKIGQGGMGVVYKGRHAMLRRPTAVKMLDVEKVNETSVARFEQEVQITCQLNNPHTVAIYDYGRTPEGVFYYAMEFLNGIDLQQLVDEHGRQPEARVVQILQQMCESLYEAHTLGLVHRDVKPANVMLNRRGGVPDVVKVLDFGLVKALDDAKAGKQSNGGMTGTPLYMSPEAIQTPEFVDVRSDIYALGAVGYFLLAGRPPFESKSVVEVIDMHLNQPIPPFHESGLSVSDDLEAVLFSCLSKDPGSRPQTAHEVSHRLSQCRIVGEWTFDSAENWWARLDRGQDTRGMTGRDAVGRSVGGKPATTPPSPVGETYLGNV